jgi:type IV pilus assembly protein PilO
MKKQVSLTPVLAIALAIIAVVGYFLLVKPKQARSAELDDQIAELETKLLLAETPSKPDAPRVQIDVADVFRLAKAMPDNDDMPGIILELNSIAVSAGVQFVAIQPGEAATKGSYDAIPITLTFEGNYYDLTDFLYRMRNLVTVRDGVLEAAGRLYTLDALDLHESEDGFPQIQAVLTVSAYSFGSEAATATPGAQTTTGATTGTTTTGTTGTTTTTETTTTTTSSGPPADPTGDGDQAALGGNG